MKNIVMKKILLFLLFFVSVLGAFSFINVAYAEETDTLAGEIKIPFIKEWEVEPSERPDKITINLYRYSANSNKELIDTRELTSADSDLNGNWACTFDVTKKAFDSNNNIYKFSVEEVVEDGYYEVYHEDPDVKFIPPEVVGSDKITPCSELNLVNPADPSQRLINALIVKKGNQTIIWTLEPLTTPEQHLVFDITDSVSGMSGLKFEKATFISGESVKYKGLTVTKETIVFDGSSDWSFYAAGLYQRSSVEENTATIRNAKEYVNINISKIWKDYDNLEELRPSYVDINLYKKVGNNVKLLKTIRLNEQNKWSWASNLEDGLILEKYDNGIKVEYYVEELGIDKDIYLSSVKQNTLDNTIDFEVTNTHEIDVKEISVIKKWLNVDSFSNLPGIKLLLKVSTDGGKSYHIINDVILNKQNSLVDKDYEWSYTFNCDYDGDKLPAIYDYIVVEDGYDLSGDEEDFFNEFFKVSTKHNDDGTVYEITNTYTGTDKLPETGSSGMLILIIMGTILFGIPVIYISYKFYDKKIRAVI